MNGESFFALFSLARAPVLSTATMATASVDAIMEPKSAASYHFHPADCICAHLQHYVSGQMQL